MMLIYIVLLFGVATVCRSSWACDVGSWWQDRIVHCCSDRRCPYFTLERLRFVQSWYSCWPTFPL